MLKQLTQFLEDMWGTFFGIDFFLVAPFVKHFFLFGRCICLNGQVIGK